MPCHLDRFQLGFARLRGVVFEVGERNHIFVQVGETDRERVEFRMNFREQNPDVVRIAPGEFFWHEWLQSKISKFQGFRVSKIRIAELLLASLKPCNLET